MKRFIAGILVALICFSAPLVSAEEKVVDGIVAVVNGDIITMYELGRKMAPIMQQFKGKALTASEADQLNKIRLQILDRMINEMIMDQEARRLKVVVSDQDINNEVQRIKESSNLDDEAFERQLALQKTTLEKFKDELRRDIRKFRLLSFKVKNKVVVTDEEIARVWNSTREKQDEVAKSMHLKLILFPENVSAADVRKQLVAGNITFEEAADKYSVGPGTGSGGDLGVLKWDDLAAAWHDALKGLKPGEISAPFDVQSSKALLKLDSYVSAETAAFDDVKDDIYDRLYSEKQDKIFDDYIKNLKEKAVIEIK